MYAGTVAGTVGATLVVARQEEEHIPVCGRPQGSPLPSPARLPSRGEMPVNIRATVARTVSVPRSPKGANHA